MSRRIFDKLAEDSPRFTVDPASAGFVQIQRGLSNPDLSQELESITSSRLSEFTFIPERCPSVHVVAIISALIDDLHAMSNDLSEIQDGIKSLGLSKISTDIPATPRFIYTPATPETDTQQDLVELEDWEIEQRLKDMTADVGLMYLDVVEMAEEGFFPNGVPCYLYSGSSSLDQSDTMGFSNDQTLEPEDVMQLLRTLAIPEMLEKEEVDEDGYLSDYSSDEDPSSDEAPKHDEDLFEDEATPTKVAQSWSAQFGSYNSIQSTPTPSDSSEDLERNTPTKELASPQPTSVVDETFHVTISPSPQLVHPESPQGRDRQPRRIQPSRTILFVPAPPPRDSMIISPPARESDSSLFSEPTPLLPFSVPLPMSSPSRDNNSRLSFWNKFKGLKRQNSFSADSSSPASAAATSPFKKIFSSPGRRSANQFTAEPTVGFVYDTTSIRGTGCLPR